MPPLLPILHGVIVALTIVHRILVLYGNIRQSPPAAPTDEAPNRPAPSKHLRKFH